MRVVAEAARRRRDLESSIRRRDRLRIIREWAPHRQDGIFGTDNGAEFSHYPRKIEFKWMAVPNATFYRVLIYQNSPNSPEGIKLQDREIKETEFVFYFPEAQTGRWRVEAVEDGGRLLAVSEWRSFRFTK